MIVILDTHRAPGGPRTCRGARPFGRRLRRQGDRCRRCRRRPCSRANFPRPEHPPHRRLRAGPPPRPPRLPPPRRPRRRPRPRPKAGGHSRARSPSRGPSPRLKELAAKGKASQGPRSLCRGQSPIMSERLVVDEASKGVKNVLVYLPKPTASTRKPSRPPVGPDRLRPGEMRLRSPRAGRDDRPQGRAQEQRPGQPQHQLAAQEQRVQHSCAGVAVDDRGRSRRPSGRRAR